MTIPSIISVIAGGIVSLPVPTTNIHVASAMQIMPAINLSFFIHSLQSFTIKFTIEAAEITKTQSKIQLSSGKLLTNLAIYT